MVEGPELLQAIQAAPLVVLYQQRAVHTGERELARERLTQVSGGVRVRVIRGGETQAAGGWAHTMSITS